jgi:predicted N-acetyltransferase YhbS
LKDYNRIAEITELAFYSMIDATHSTFLPEKNMIALLRHGSMFDPELSLVAEVDGQIVGHALYYPFEMRLTGEPIKAVSLGPIATHPAFQKQGIGMALMEEGHRRAKAKGYAFAFLLGHPSYYSRAGYIMGVFGKCQLSIPVAQITGTADGVEQRLIQSEDIETFTTMWKSWFDDVDLALFPGDTLIEWVSHAEEFMSYTIVQNGDIIGYLRYKKQNPANVRMFLAKDQHATKQLLALLRDKINETETTHITLPLHPASQMVKKCLTMPYEVELDTWDAAMVKILDPENAAIANYCEEVRQKTRQPGLVIYPPTIEFAE